jgi:hypothetical protein
MSGRKNSLLSFKIVSAGDQSLATVTSTITSIEFLDNIGIQVNILTGTASGSFDVQISGDHREVNGNVTVAGNWISLGSSYTATVTSGSPANIYFDLNQLSAPYVRLLYTKSSGTGTFDAFVVGKMI